MEAEKKDIIICAINGRRITSREAEKQYGIVGVHSMHHSLYNSDLYSGTGQDPIAWANFDVERLAVDDQGNKLPYDITMSLRGLLFDRDRHLLELMDKKSRRLIMSQQILIMHVIVFKDQESKDMYEMADACFIREY